MKAFSGTSSAVGYQQNRQPQVHELTAVTSYHFPSATAQKVRRIYSCVTFIFFFSMFYEITVLVFLLKVRRVHNMRHRAEGLYERTWGQAWSIVPRLWLTYSLLLLPTAILQQWARLKYVPDTPNWWAWSREWGSEFVGGVIMFPILIWLVYVLIRKSPRWWWVWFCLIAMVWSSLFGLWALVGADDNQYLPLGAENPGLASQIQSLAARDHFQVPVQDMRVRLVAKSPGPPYAYTSGVGPRRRIVIGSDAIGKLNSDQMSFVASHEIGHYRLNHPLKKLVFSLVFIIPIISGWYSFAHWLHWRWGAIWGIPTLGDWTSLPLLYLALTLMLQIGSLMENIYSWHHERQADQYALELMHGAVASPNQSAAQALQILGEDALEPSQTHLLIHIFLSDHPPIADRIRFLIHYDPWHHGCKAKFVKGP